MYEIHKKNGAKNIIKQRNRNIQKLSVLITASDKSLLLKY